MLGKHIALCEDSLTAAVFTHLLHLPSEVFWKLLATACCTNCLPDCVGEPIAVEGWPCWDGTNTGNSSHVIPDLFIRFTSFDLIIEAKRWDGEMQDSDQWKRELIAYTNEYGKEKKPVRMIALGGLRTRSDQQIKYHVPTGEAEAPARELTQSEYTLICPIHMCRWEALLLRCERLLKELEAVNYTSSQILAHIRTLKDLIDLFRWHGFSTGKWFADFNFSVNEISWDGKSPSFFSAIQPPVLSQ